MTQYQLPNGQLIYQHNTYETDFVFNEIFVDEIYIQKGIKLKDNAIVFDVGANIGLFSLYIQQNFPTSKIYAFEPAPEIFRLLKLNTTVFGNNISLYNCGLSETEQECLFYYYPDFSVISGFHADRERDANIIISGMRSIQTKQITEIEVLVKKRLEELVAVPSKVTTLSNFIKQEQINVIDLLKIDVEGSELAVLRGVCDQDWNKIQQIVMEVHNKADLHKILTLLAKYGFQLTIEEDKYLKNAGIYNVFAIKQK